MPVVNVTENRTTTWLDAANKTRGEKEPLEAAVVRGVATKDKVIALTFDDAPRPTTTHDLLQVLVEKKAPATFFMIGKQVDRFPSVVSEVALNGCSVGNHSYSHAKMTDLPAGDQLTEYRACNDAIRAVTEVPIQFCRPPGGDVNLEVERAAAAEGMKTVFWTDDPVDYTEPGEDKILSYTLSHLTNGGIILLHDGVEQTVDVLGKMIDEIRSRGYKIVPLSELPSSRVGHPAKSDAGSGLNRRQD